MLMNWRTGTDRAILISLWPPSTTLEIAEKCENAARSLFRLATAVCRPDVAWHFGDHRAM